MTAPTTTIPERIAELLADTSRGGTFAARRSVGTDDLRIEVKGVGPLRLPVSRAQAQRLCKVARPARYGLRDVEALGGELEIIAHFPEGDVRISQFEEV